MKVEGDVRIIEGIIMGAVFSFGAHLSQVPKSLTVGESEEAGPIAEEIVAWAKSKGMNHDSIDVDAGWEKALQHD